MLEMIWVVGPWTSEVLDRVEDGRITEVWFEFRPDVASLEGALR